MSTRRQEFTRKPHGGKFIYTWKPETEITKKGKKAKTVETGCSATAGELY
jgi:hypothetical protein